MIRRRLRRLDESVIGVVAVKYVALLEGQRLRISRNVDVVDDM